MTHTKRAASNDVALLLSRCSTADSYQGPPRHPQRLGKTDVQTVIAHKIGKRPGQHAAALQIAKEAIKDYVVTPDIKIAVTLPSAIACIPWRCKSENSEEV